MSVKPYMSDEEVVSLIRAGMSMSEISERMTPSGRTGCTQHARVKKLAMQHGLEIKKKEGSRRTSEEIYGDTRLQEYIRAVGRLGINVENGVVLVGSDSHYWPGIRSAAHRAFLDFCRYMKPRAVIKNGDAFDGSTVSRWPRIGWDSRPTVQEELKTVKERMDEIEDAASTKELYWPLGNHDARFETFLASKAPEYEGVQGFHLKDHFPLWRACWSVWLNDDVVVKHRFKSGIHATHNNTLWAGKTMVTGHLHSLKVTPISDYSGTRYGVDCGTMAQPYGPQFSGYVEDNPVNWRSGFVVLTFWRQKLLMPEPVQVLDEERGLVQFRGQVMEV